MFIKNAKTSVNLRAKELAGIFLIEQEVKQHGFYSAFCLDLADALCHDELINRIKKMAVQAHLKVSFNASEDICVFEAQ